MRNLLVILSICFFGGVHAQTKWERTYGAWGIERAHAVKQATDTGFVVVGSSSSFGNQSQFYIVKTDKAGAIDWTKNYGGEGVETAYDVAITPDSGFAVVGITNSYGNGYQIYLTRLNKNGDSLWTKTYGGSDWDFAYAIELMPDSGFIIAGETYSYGNGNNDGYVLRLNKHGDTLWTKTFGGSESDYLKDIKIDYQGNLVAVGGTKNFGAQDEDIYLLKLTADGTTKFNSVYGFAGDDFASKLTIDTGGFVVAASTHIYGSDDFEGLVVAFDTNGVKKYEQVFFDHSAGANLHQHARAITKYKYQDSVVVGADEIQNGTLAVGNTISGIKLELAPGMTRDLTTDFFKYVSSFDAVFVTDVDTCYDGGYIYCAYGNGRIGSGGNMNIYVLKTGRNNLTNCGDYDQSCILNMYDFSAGFASVSDASPSGNELVVYPNPISINDQLSLSNIPGGVIKINMFDRLGNLVLSKKLNEQNNYSLTLSNYQLTQGVYTIQLVRDLGANLTKRLVLVD